MIVLSDNFPHFIVYYDYACMDFRASSDFNALYRATLIQITLCNSMADVELELLTRLNELCMLLRIFNHYLTHQNQIIAAIIEVLKLFTYLKQ